MGNISLTYILKSAFCEFDMILHLSHFLAGFFNKKIWLIDWQWSVWLAGGRASISRLKFWLKFCFLTIIQMFSN